MKRPLPPTAFFCLWLICCIFLWHQTHLTDKKKSQAITALFILFCLKAYILLVSILTTLLIQVSWHKQECRVTHWSAWSYYPIKTESFLTCTAYALEPVIGSLFHYWPQWPRSQNWIWVHLDLTSGWLPSSQQKDQVQKCHTPRPLRPGEMGGEARKLTTLLGREVLKTLPLA